MAMGKRVAEGQESFWIATADLPSAPGHPFYEHLNKILHGNDFDRLVETRCRKFYAVLSATTFCTRAREFSPLGLLSSSMTNLRRWYQWSFKTRFIAAKSAVWFRINDFRPGGSGIRFPPPLGIVNTARSAVARAVHQTRIKCDHQHMKSNGLFVSAN